MMRLSLTVLLTIAVLTWVSCGQPVNVDVVPNPTAEAERHAVIGMDEWAVYEGILQGHDSAAFIVVDEANAMPFGDTDTNQLLAIMSGLQPDTVEDFAARNTKPIRPVSFPYEDERAIISPADVAELYPQASQYDIVSRVGFSRDGRQALVYWVNHCPALCAEGAYVVLSKAADGWHIEGKFRTFVS